MSQQRNLALSLPVANCFLLGVPLNDLAGFFFS
jgi:hypothetical protein